MATVLQSCRLRWISRTNPASWSSILRATMAGAQCISMVRWNSQCQWITSGLKSRRIIHFSCRGSMLWAILGSLSEPNSMAFPSLCLMAPRKSRRVTLSHPKKVHSHHLVQFIKHNIDWNCNCNRWKSLSLRWANMQNVTLLMLDLLAAKKQSSKQLPKKYTCVRYLRIGKAPRWCVCILLVWFGQLLVCTSTNTPVQVNEDTCHCIYWWYRSVCSSTNTPVGV